MTYQSKYFSESELRCKCNTCQKKQASVNVDEELLVVMDRIREKLNCPVYVTSCVRCEEHNKKVGGVKNSYHIQGKAADLKVLRPQTIRELYEAAEACGADGIGFYIRSGFIHVDVRGKKARWVE